MLYQNVLSVASYSVLLNSTNTALLSDLQKTKLLGSTVKLVDVSRLLLVG